MKGLEAEDRFQRYALDAKHSGLSIAQEVRNP